MGATGLAESAKEMIRSSWGTRLHRFTIGPYALERPTVSCGGRLGFALFGAEVLHRFDVVFDYRRDRLILEPNELYDAPQRSDASGMTLVADEDDLGARRVAFVSPGTPAAEAGIEVDDLLLAIDGEPADSRELHATRELFYRPGSSFELQLRRNGETFKVTLHCRELL